MSSLRDPFFFKSVKGKIILGFVIACIALGASWVISNLAFKNMLTQLEVIGTPNEKLRLVNNIFKNILQLDQLQNTRSIKGDEIKEEVLRQSARLAATLDTLSQLSVEDPVQIIRLDSMKKILVLRERIYDSYVRERSKLVSNKDLSDEVKNISGLITTTKGKPDSTIVKTEKRTTTTTVYTETQDTTSQQKAAVQKKGFFGRVFGSKKNKKIPVEPAKVIQKQEVNVQVDTIKVVKEDSTIEKVEEAVSAIEKSQKIRTTSFVDREQELADAGNTLVRQLLRVMQEVEGDVLAQYNLESGQSKSLVTSTVDNLEWVMLGFFLLTGMLAYLIFMDITRSNGYRRELVEAKEEAEFHSMAKQRFLSNMSHEIRTPLQSIIGYTEALLKDPKPKRQDLETLHSASEHLLYLVNEVLDYSRIISDRFTFEERTFAVSPMLNEVIKMLTPTASAKGLRLIFENKLPAGLYLKGDPFRIRQILYNLLTNAIKFTENGEVSLKVTGVETKSTMIIEYQIADTGIGLSEDQVQKVFNQFEQADPSISRRYGGTGLGLSIVKALVEGMQGNIRVKSIPDEGTTFFVSTSMKKADKTEMETPEAPERSYHIAGKVWLVDDDAFILKWCSSVLDLNGVPHTAFSSAEEVLNRPWDPNVKFVLTDLRMSGMNGAELVKRLRKSAAEDVKFYVLTAQALPEERENLLKMGFDGFLMKPFHSRELLELLELASDGQVINPYTDLDFTALNEMTFGDDNLMREILEEFVKDCRIDIIALNESLENNELTRVQELMHRMAGRTGQIGARQLSADFRSNEIALRNNPGTVSTEDMKQLVQFANEVIEQVGERALAYSM
ncbi:ATP-binding protein [Dyadobacter sandarakinus]|uniref:histidine kinase n=1 Tax=Dyadobacter sandarakinus TaxID=2747268 RepID=A0ABX7ICC6_9BACT|nr:ATP-binding protein [Dyadobacter sandarakinus]QRR03373.1 response regulator [Dyadobacter sandarakinus]